MIVLLNKIISGFNISHRFTPYNPVERPSAGRAVVSWPLPHFPEEPFFEDFYCKLITACPEPCRGELVEE